MKTTIKITAVGALFLAAAVFSHAATAQENWENDCAKCHGADGKGQTKIGKKLKLKDYTDASVQAAMTDEEMLKAINDGIVENGKEKMKPFKAAYSAAEVSDLVAFIRQMKG